MDLYFSPLACSLASRITLYEANVEASYHQVSAQKQLADGGDYRGVYPLALVPALRLEDGTVLTENIAVLVYLGETHDLLGDRIEALRWLSFIATELHKTVFAPLFDSAAPPEAKRYALEKSESRLAHLERHMQGRSFVLDRFSVVDAFLYTVLTWTRWVSGPSARDRVRSGSSA